MLLLTYLHNRRLNYCRPDSTRGVARNLFWGLNILGHIIWNNKIKRGLQQTKIFSWFWEICIPSLRPYRATIMSRDIWVPTPLLATSGKKPLFLRCVLISRSTHSRHLIEICFPHLSVGFQTHWVCTQNESALRIHHLNALFVSFRTNSSPVFHLSSYQ